MPTARDPARRHNWNVLSSASQWGSPTDIADRRDMVDEDIDRERVANPAT
jgi:hypothetical protein